MKKALIIAALAGASFMLCGNARADWIGDTVGLTYYFPDLNTVYQSQVTTTVGGTFTDVGKVPGVSVTVGASQITINLDASPATSATWASWPSFDGFILTDLSNNPLITGVTLASTTDYALTQSAISFTSDSIAVNWPGITFGQDSQAILDLAFDPPLFQNNLCDGDCPDPVPEPASLPLFGVGLAGVAFLLLRRRRAA